MSAIERLAVHLIAHQRLRLQQAGHVERLVIIVGARYLYKAGVGIGANELEKIRDAGAAEVADYIPTLHANVAGILRYLGQRLDLRQSIFTWPLDLAFYSERPIFQVHFGINHVVSVVGKFLKRYHSRVAKGRGQCRSPKQLARGPIAEGHPMGQQRFTDFRDGECASQHDGRELEHLPPIHALERLLAKD